MPGREGALLRPASSVVQTWPWHGHICPLQEPGAARLRMGSGSGKGQQLPRSWRAMAAIRVPAVPGAELLAASFRMAWQGCRLWMWEQPVPPWVSRSSPGAGDAGLFPARSRYLAVPSVLGTC